jgi:hypothetical protein
VPFDDEFETDGDDSIENTRDVGINFNSDILQILNLSICGSSDGISIDDGCFQDRWMITIINHSSFKLHHAASLPPDSSSTAPDLKHCPPCLRFFQKNIPRAALNTIIAIAGPPNTQGDTSQRILWVPL